MESNQKTTRIIYFIILSIMVVSSIVFVSMVMKDLNNNSNLMDNDSAQLSTSSLEKNLEKSFIGYNRSRDNSPVVINNLKEKDKAFIVRSIRDEGNVLSYIEIEKNLKINEISIYSKFYLQGPSNSIDVKMKPVHQYDISHNWHKNWHFVDSGEVLTYRDIKKVKNLKSVINTPFEKYVLNIKTQNVYIPADSEYVYVPQLNYGPSTTPTTIITSENSSNTTEQNTTTYNTTYTHNTTNTTDFIASTSSYVGTTTQNITQNTTYITSVTTNNIPNTSTSVEKTTDGPSVTNTPNKTTPSSATSTSTTSSTTTSSTTTSTTTRPDGNAVVPIDNDFIINATLMEGHEIHPSPDWYLTMEYQGNVYYVNNHNIKHFNSIAYPYKRFSFRSSGIEVDGVYGNSILLRNFNNIHSITDFEYIDYSQDTATKLENNLITEYPSRNVDNYSNLLKTGKGPINLNFVVEGRDLDKRIVPYSDNLSTKPIILELSSKEYGNQGEVVGYIFNNPDNIYNADISVYEVVDEIDNFVVKASVSGVSGTVSGTRKYDQGYFLSNSDRLHPIDFISTRPKAKLEELSDSTDPTSGYGGKRSTTFKISKPFDGTATTVNKIAGKNVKVYLEPNKNISRDDINRISEILNHYEGQDLYIKYDSVKFKRGNTTFSPSNQEYVVEISSYKDLYLTNKDDVDWDYLIALNGPKYEFKNILTQIGVYPSVDLCVTVQNGKLIINDQGELIEVNVDTEQAFKDHLVKQEGRKFVITLTNVKRIENVISGHLDKSRVYNTRRNVYGEIENYLNRTTYSIDTSVEVHATSDNESVELTILSNGNGSFVVISDNKSIEPIIEFTDKQANKYFKSTKVNFTATGKLKDGKFVISDLSSLYTNKNRLMYSNVLVPLYAYKPSKLVSEELISKISKKQDFSITDDVTLKFRLSYGVEEEDIFGMPYIEDVVYKLDLQLNSEDRASFVSKIRDYGILTGSFKITGKLIDGRFNITFVPDYSNVALINNGLAEEETNKYFDLRDKGFTSEDFKQEVESRDVAEFSTATEFVNDVVNDSIDENKVYEIFFKRSHHNNIFAYLNDAKVKIGVLYDEILNFSKYHQHLFNEDYLEDKVLYVKGKVKKLGNDLFVYPDFSSIKLTNVNDDNIYNSILSREKKQIINNFGIENTEVGEIKEFSVKLIPSSISWLSGTIKPIVGNDKIEYYLDYSFESKKAVDRLFNENKKIYFKAAISRKETQYNAIRIYLRVIDSTIAVVEDSIPREVEDYLNRLTTESESSTLSQVEIRNSEQATLTFAKIDNSWKMYSPRNIDRFASVSVSSSDNTIAMVLSNLPENTLYNFTGTTSVEYDRDIPYSISLNVSQINRVTQDESKITEIKNFNPFKSVPRDVVYSPDREAINRYEEVSLTVFTTGNGIYLYENSSSKIDESNQIFLEEIKNYPFSMTENRLDSIRFYNIIVQKLPNGKFLRLGDSSLSNDPRLDMVDNNTLYFYNLVKVKDELALEDLTDLHLKKGQKVRLTFIRSSTGHTVLYNPNLTFAASDLDLSFRLNEKYISIPKEIAFTADTYLPTDFNETRYGKYSLLLGGHTLWLENIKGVNNVEELLNWYIVDFHDYINDNSKYVFEEIEGKEATNAISEDLFESDDVVRDLTVIYKEGKFYVYDPINVEVASFESLETMSRYRDSLDSFYNSKYEGIFNGRFEVRKQGRTLTQLKYLGLARPVIEQEQVKDWFTNNVRTSSSVPLVPLEEAKQLDKESIDNKASDKGELSSEPQESINIDSIDSNQDNTNDDNRDSDNIIENQLPPIKLEEDENQVYEGIENGENNSQTESESTGSE